MEEDDFEDDEFISNAELISKYGNDPAACNKLSDEQLESLLTMKAIAYGLEPDEKSGQVLAEIYALFAERTVPSDRQTILSQVTEFVEGHEGDGYNALWLFIAVDPDEQLRAEAALNLASLIPADDEEPFTGPATVLNYIAQQAVKGRDVTSIFAGILHLGDARLLPMLEATWDKLPREVQLRVPDFTPMFASHAVIEFYLKQLKRDCEKCLFGSVCNGLGKMAKHACHTESGVVDVERAFPAYSDDDPIQLLRKWTLREYLSEIRPTLKEIESQELEPKSSPKVLRMWEAAAELED
jgi:hypothetical protein